MVNARPTNVLWNAATRCFIRLAISDEIMRFKSFREKGVRDSRVSYSDFDIASNYSKPCLRLEDRRRFEHPSLCKSAISRLIAISRTLPACTCGYIVLEGVVFH